MIEFILKVESPYSNVSNRSILQIKESPYCSTSRETKWSTDVFPLSFQPKSWEVILEQRERLDNTTKEIYYNIL